MLGGAGVTSSADLGPAPTRLRPGRIATRNSLEPVLGVEIGSPPHREIVRGSRAPSVGPTAPEGPVGTRRAGRDAEPPDTRKVRLLGLVAGPASNGAARYARGPPSRAAASSRNEEPAGYARGPPRWIIWIIGAGPSHHVPPARFERATPALGERCSIP